MTRRSYAELMKIEKRSGDYTPLCGISDFIIHQSEKHSFRVFCGGGYIGNSRTSLSL